MTVFAGGFIYAADINVLLNPPLCKVVQQSAQSLTSATDTPLTFGVGSTVEDTHSMHNEGTNTTRLVVPTGYAGWWQLDAVLFMAAPGSGITFTELQVSFYINGSVQVPRSRPGSGPNITNVSASSVGLVTVEANEGDYFESVGTQIASTAGTKQTSAGGSFSSTFTARFLRPSA